MAGYSLPQRGSAGYSPSPLGITRTGAVLSIYLYIIIALIVVLVLFVVRQVRLRQAIARRRALRQDDIVGASETMTGVGTGNGTEVQHA